MKLKTLFVAAIAAVFATQACNNNQNNNQNDYDPTHDSINNSADLLNESKLGDDANNFIEKAAADGKMEVELGKIAMQNAASADVKNLAGMIIKDHEDANEKLKNLANRKNVIVAEELPADKQAMVDELKKLKGAEFDKRYAEMMVKDHAKAIDLFNEAAQNSKNEDIREFAAQTLPALKKHKAKAEELQAKM